MKKYLLLISLLFLASLDAQMRKSTLVNLQKFNPNIRFELAYATKDNFTEEIIYDTSACFILQEVAIKLDAIQKELQKMVSKDHPKGLGLKIWDGYRPLSAQKKMWDACAKQFPDENEREHYILNPAKGGGRHTRGTTVDLTLIDLATGRELNMGTGFDDFSKKAWRDYAGISDEIRYNRKLLETVMAKYDFKGITSEWWHFDYKDWKEYEPLDIPLAYLAKTVS